MGAGAGGAVARPTGSVADALAVWAEPTAVRMPDPIPYTQAVAAVADVTCKLVLALAPGAILSFLLANVLVQPAGTVRARLKEVLLHWALSLLITFSV